MDNHWGHIDNIIRFLYYGYVLSMEGRYSVFYRYWFRESSTKMGSPDCAQTRRKTHFNYHGYVRSQIEFQRHGYPNCVNRDQHHLACLALCRYDGRCLWTETSCSVDSYASMANLGGISTAPAVTAAYEKQWMPHAIVLAILSMVTGTVWGLFTIFLFEWIVL